MISGDCMFPCPICGGDSVAYHYYKNIWPVCRRCRVKWWGGYGLISLPDDIDPVEMAEEAEVELRKYTLVGYDS
jgi:hypothetical protein